MYKVQELDKLQDLNQTQELNLQELDQVAGGVPPIVIIGLVGLGLFGAGFVGGILLHAATVGPMRMPM